MTVTEQNLIWLLEGHLRRAKEAGEEVQVFLKGGHTLRGKVMHIEEVESGNLVKEADFAIVLTYHSTFMDTLQSFATKEAQFTTMLSEVVGVSAIKASS